MLSFPDTTTNILITKAGIILKNMGLADTLVKPIIIFSMKQISAKNHN